MKNKNENYTISFVSFLKNRVAENNNSIAFIYKDKEYSWIDIDKASNIVATDLSILGVKKGTHVGICGVNSINWIFTFFGVLKLGGIAVLINSSLTPYEVSNVCNIGGVEILCYSEIEGITTFDMYKDVCLLNKNIKKIYNISDSVDYLLRINEINDFENEYVEKSLADDASIIMFTSGSTGKPKAVLTSPYNLMFSIKPIIENVHYSINDKVLAFLPFFHVFGLISSVAAGIITGCCSIIPSSKKPAELISLIDKYKITLFNTVPTMMLAIVNHKDFESSKLSSIRSTILGGAITTKDQMIMLKKKLPNNHFGNVYGMTENAFISITDYEDSFEHITETVGKPLQGITMKIVDINGSELPIGQEGEVCLKSGGMLVWYYKLPIDMQPIDDYGYLKTGDLGYIDQDGYLRLTGRIKDLIICGGENISPLEVSEKLVSLDHFIDVKVVGIPDEIKGEVVGCALILKKDYVFNEIEIKKELSTKLAKYKMPVYFKVFKSFPLLGTGKIDKVTIVNEIIKEFLK